MVVVWEHRPRDYRPPVPLLDIADQIRESVSLLRIVEYTFPTRHAVVHVVHRPLELHPSSPNHVAIISGHSKVLMPGTDALRTIDTLKNLTQAEAHLFARVARYGIGQSIFDLGNEFWESQGLALSDFLELQELGLLIMSAKFGLAFTITSTAEDRFVNHLTYGDQVIQIEHEDSNKQIRLGCYRLTRTGLDLSHLIRTKASPEYLQSSVKKITDAGGEGCKVSIAQVLQDLGNDTLRPGPLLPVQDLAAVKEEPADTHAQEETAQESEPPG